MRHAGYRVALTVGLLLCVPVTGRLWGGPREAVAAGGESAFVGLTPCRLVDTRGNGFGGAFGPPALATGVPRDFPLQGQCGIPATATGVSLNVTATNTQGPGFLLLYPQGGVQPLVSTLNYIGGETVANAAIEPLGPGGLTVVAGVAGTDLILDVNGYFTDGLVHAVDTDNIFVGVGAGNLATTGDGNTAVGSRALAANTTGFVNTAIGQEALQQNTEGYGNVAIGNRALLNQTTGNNNIAIGQLAGFNVTAGIRNIHIGSIGNPADSSTIRPGEGRARTFIGGINGVTPASSTVPVLIDSNGQLATNPSSRRVKTDIEDIGERGRGLQALRPVSFRYRVHSPGGPLEYGLIAEEVAEVYPELVVRDAGGAPEAVRYQLLPALLLNELQRQERVLAEKDGQLRAQAERLQAQGAQLTELATAVAELTARLTRLEGGQPFAATHPAAP